jgi:hypothetical protein
MIWTGFAATAAKKGINAAWLAAHPNQTKQFGEVARIPSSTGADRDAKFRAIVEALNRHQTNVAATSPALVGKRALVAAALAAASAR